MVTTVDSTTANAASALVWTWIAGNIGPISTIILMVIAMSKYLEKHNADKIEQSKKDVLLHVDMKLESIMKDIETMRTNEELVRDYLERDIAEMKRDLKIVLGRLALGGTGGSNTVGFDSPEPREDNTTYHYRDRDKTNHIR